MVGSDVKSLIQEVIKLLNRQSELGLSGVDSDLAALDAPWFFEKTAPVPSDRHSTALAPLSQETPTNAAEVKALLEAKLAPADRPKRIPKVKAPEPAPKSSVGGSPLTQLRERVSRCESCSLSRSRSQTVFGEGRPDAPLMFVGDGPGRDEDRQGEPFLGEVGALLNKMIRAMGLPRHEVYLTTLTKCRPPRSRGPEVDEMRQCLEHLDAQIELIKPKVIVTLGQTVSQVILERSEAITELRGQFHMRGQAKVMPTYHPAYLLKVPKAKATVWHDLQIVMTELGLKGR